MNTVQPQLHLFSIYRGNHCFTSEDFTLHRRMKLIENSRELDPWPMIGNHQWFNIKDQRNFREKNSTISKSTIISMYHPIPSPYHERIETTKDFFFSFRWGVGYQCCYLWFHTTYYLGVGYPMLRNLNDTNDRGGMNDTGGLQEVSITRPKRKVNNILTGDIMHHA